MIWQRFVCASRAPLDQIVSSTGALAGLSTAEIEYRPTAALALLSALLNALEGSTRKLR